MSLGLRVPNFPISQIVLDQLGWDFLGNWEIGKYIPLPSSQFPKQCWASWAEISWEIGKLGSMYLYSFPNFPNFAGPSGLGFFWEIGKLGSIYLHSFPNFPNSAGPAGLGFFGKLGNWEVCTCTHFPISQIVLSQMG